jgi:dTDP-glucose 4,6-dehydratase/UDP-glucose 4-epimerase
MTSGNKRYLVTGGTGFLGSALVRRLVREGRPVRVIDNDSRGARARLADVADHVEIVGGDIRDAAAVDAAVRGVDCVAHLAYINGTEFFYTKPDLILEVAVKGMMNVLDACLKHNVLELSLASSSEVYQTAPLVPTPENVPLVGPDVMNPRFSYGGGKIISELRAINYGRKNFRKLTVFRPHNVYGPDMGWEHVIPQFAVRMAELSRGQASGRIPFPIQGNGRETRAFVYVEDAVDGIVRLMDRGEHLGIYHVGNDEEVTVGDLGRKVARCFGREIDVIPGPLQPGRTVRRCPDITKLRAIGYRPAHTLDDGLSKAVAWYSENIDRRPRK